MSPLCHVTSPLPVNPSAPTVSAAVVTAPLGASLSAQVWLDVLSVCAVCAVAVPLVPDRLTRYGWTEPPGAVVYRSAVPSLFRSAA